MSVVRLRRRGARVYGYDFWLHGQRYQATVGPTKTLARLAEDAKRRALHEGRVARVWGVRVPRPARGAPTLAGYVAAHYDPEHVAGLQPSSQVTIRSQLARLTRSLGRVPLDQLGPEPVGAYARARAREVGATMVSTEVWRLSSVLKHAVRARVIPAHPLAGWQRPRPARRHYPILSRAAELRALRARPAWAILWALVLDTGLRKGELRLLRWSEVDLKAGRLRLVQPKTGVEKVVPLTRRCLDALRALPHRQGYVVGRSPTRPLALSTFNWRLRRVLELARLPRLRVHDLRHNFATRALDTPEGHLPTVGEMLGHRPPYRQTLRYVHPLEDAKRRISAALGRGAADLFPPGLRNRSLRKSLRAGRRGR